jgi:predicted SnoaL-like aldol condensation-catalyzing enzyme
MTLSKKIILGTAMALSLTLSAAVMASSSSEVVRDLSTEQQNMQTARNLYAAIFTTRDATLAKSFLGPQYIQHAPNVADGREGLALAIADIIKQTPQISYEVKHIMAEGDLVTVMGQLRETPGARGQMIFSIFRFNAGKVVEHWEALQDVPETSANGNGVF